MRMHHALTIGSAIALLAVLFVNPASAQAVPRIVLPIASEATAPPLEEWRNRLVVQVASDGAMTVEGRAYADLDQLVKRLFQFAEMHRGSDGTCTEALLIRADARVPFRRVSNILKLCSKNPIRIHKTDFAATNPKGKECRVQAHLLVDIAPKRTVTREELEAMFDGSRYIITTHQEGTTSVAFGEQMIGKIRADEIAVPDLTRVMQGLGELRVITIDTDGEVPHGHVVALMNELRKIDKKKDRRITFTMPPPEKK